MGNGSEPPSWCITTFQWVPLCLRTQETHCGRTWWYLRMGLMTSTELWSRAGAPAAEERGREREGSHSSLQGGGRCGQHGQVKH